MKIIAINGSSRINGNTAELLSHALRGAAEGGAETELIHLRPLNYRGCASCFYCKDKKNPHGICAMRDDLSPVLEAIKECDGLILGSPIYYGGMSSNLLAFLERFLYSNSIYSNEIPTVFPKPLPWGMIYDMNMSKPEWDKMGLENNLLVFHNSIIHTLRQRPQILFVHNTLQFADYAQYESSMFSPEEKAEHHRVQFPLDCEAAAEMGRKVVSKAKFLKEREAK